MVLGDDYIYTNSCYKQRFCVRRGVHVGYKKEELWLNQTAPLTDSLSPVPTWGLTLFRLEVSLTPAPVFLYLFVPLLRSWSKHVTILIPSLNQSIRLSATQGKVRDGKCAPF